MVITRKLEVTKEYRYSYQYPTTQMYIRTLDSERTIIKDTIRMNPSITMVREPWTNDRT